MTDTTLTAERPRVWKVTSAYRNSFGNLLVMTIEGANDTVQYFIPSLRRAGWLTIDSIGTSVMYFPRPVVLEFNARSGCLMRVVLP